MSSLILNGWAQPVDALLQVVGDALMFDYSDFSAPEASFPALKKFKAATQVIAWSLGAQLALRAIAAGVLAPEHLVLVAPPYRFVSAAVPKGMDAFTFRQFRDNYAQNPARTKARFHALVAKGDGDFARVLDQLTHHPNVEDTARWLPWLDDLGRYSLDAVALNDLPPTLVVHGAQDAVVPLEQSAWLAQKYPAISHSVWDGAGHAPHLHDAPMLRAEIAAHRAMHGVAA